MSTLMSTDMNITRPSTRLHAPPGKTLSNTTLFVIPSLLHDLFSNITGGASSISFGDQHDAAPPRPPTSSSIPSPPPAVDDKVNKTVAAAVAPKTICGKVGIVVGGSIASEKLIECLVKELVLIGVSACDISITNIDDPLALPYVAKSQAKDYTVVIASAVLVGVDASAAAQTVSLSLVQAGLLIETPIVAALVGRTSLLEVKALLPDLAKKWASSATSLMSIKGGLSPPAVQASEPVLLPTVTSMTSSVEILLFNFRQSLKDHGIFGLARKFRIADDDGSGSISFSEFTKMIDEHTLEWTPQQKRLVFDHFDADGSGSISYTEFLIGVRGELNDRRKQLVLMAFDILDADKSGAVELNDIKGKYDASRHPDVLSGKQTADQVLATFLGTFDGDGDGKITPTEFIKYYGNCSASMDDDDYFELMMRNAWHISGGEGWCANSSCRRVLVVHTDGRQTVEEIKNDLGIGPRDKEKMIANLVAQGINDVSSIDISGSTTESTSDGVGGGVSSGSTTTLLATGCDAQSKPAAGSAPPKQPAFDHRSSSEATAYPTRRARGSTPGGGASSIQFG